MSQNPFTVFFGSSTESLSFMETVASWIESNSNTRVVPWNAPEAFPAGHYTFDRLLELTRTCDAAVFLFNEDDKVWYRDAEHSQPRDNVLLEYGLFASRIGVKNTVICRVGKPRIASDLLGITAIHFPAGQLLDGKRRLMHWFSLCIQGAQSSSTGHRQMPSCEHVARHLLPAETRQLISDLPNWSVLARPDEVSLGIQHLIQRAFEFETFQKAVCFMSIAAPKIDSLNHHPEWENIWTTVTVRTTTWGVGNQITALDIQLAKLLEDIYARYSAGDA